jgi:hypothetical protein
MFDLHYDNLWSSEVVITAFKIIGVESQFTKAIFSVSITFTDACQEDSSFYKYVGLLEIWSNPIMGHMWETLCHEDIMMWYMHMTFLSS